MVWLKKPVRFKKRTVQFLKRMCSIFRIKTSNTKPFSISNQKEQKFMLKLLKTRSSCSGLKALHTVQLGDIGDGVFCLVQTTIWLKGGFSTGDSRTRKYSTRGFHSLCSRGSDTPLVIKCKRVFSPGTSLII